MLIGLARADTKTMAVNPVSQPYNWTFRRVVWATLVLVSIIFCFWLFYRFYQVVFILFIAIVIGTVIQTHCQLVVSAGASPDRGSHSCLSPAADPAYRLPLVVVSIDLRAKFNAGKGSARLLPKPARWDG